MTGLPKRFPDRRELASVRAESDALEAGAESSGSARVAGRVLGRRAMGKVVFLDIVDQSGRLQLVCSADRAGAVDVDLGDIVGASGAPTKTKRGEPSLAVDELILLAKNRRPLPDTFHGLKDQELRYRQRHLDLLMNEETRPRSSRGRGSWRRFAPISTRRGSSKSRRRCFSLGTEAPSRARS